MKYKARIADSLLKEKLDTFGAVLIIGPKGCGKTTTAKQQSKSVIEFQDEEKKRPIFKYGKRCTEYAFNRRQTSTVR